MNAVDDLCVSLKSVKRLASRVGFQRVYASKSSGMHLR